MTKTDIVSYFVSSLYLTRTLICMGTKISWKQDGLFNSYNSSPSGLGDIQYFGDW